MTAPFVDLWISNSQAGKAVAMRRNGLKSRDVKVIYSGIDYDPWMEKLLSASKSKDRQEIVVADLVGKKTGDNPHIWYDPATMLALAQSLTDLLASDDPANKEAYQKRLAGFQASLKPIEDKIAALKQRLADFTARRVMVTHMNPSMLARLDEVRQSGVLIAEDGLMLDL